MNPLLFRCYRLPKGQGWRCVGGKWTFEDSDLDHAKACAKEIAPRAIFVVVFSPPYRPPKKKRRSLTRFWDVS